MGQMTGTYMRASHCALLLRACTITDVYAWAQTTAVFVRFLREASTFYALLTSKLQAAYGRLGFTLEFPGLDDLDAVSEQTAMPEFKTSLDCRISIYRCLICLGDLAR